MLKVNKRLHLGLLGMKYIDFLQVIAQVFPFIRPKNPHGKAENGPQVNRMVFAFVVLGQVMDLRVAVMAGCDAIIGIR